MRPRTTPYDPADFLDDEEAIAEYLRLTCEDGSPTEIARALGAVVRARGMSEIAKKTGLTKQTLQKALRDGGDPELSVIAKVAEALGFRLAILPAQKSARDFEAA